MNIKKIFISLAIGTLSLCAVQSGVLADNCARYSNVATYINHYPIKSFAVNGAMAVCVDDLTQYGFSHEWDGSTKTLNIVRDYSKTAITASVTPQTEVFGDMLNTPAAYFGNNDVSVYVNGTDVPSYNISGYIFIPFDSLNVFGEMNWAAEQNAQKLWLEGLPIAAYRPMLPGYRYTMKKSERVMKGLNGESRYITLEYPVFETTRYSDVFVYLNNVIGNAINESYNIAIEHDEIADWEDKIKVTYDGNGVIGFVGFAYNYFYGAAHGYGGYYDMGCYSIYDGHYISIYDFIYESKLTPSNIRSIYLSQHSRSVFFFPDSVDDFSLDNLGWYMSNNGVVLYANPYGLASYADGIMEATIYPGVYGSYYKNFIQTP